jgi:hypothetical protein
MADLNHLGGLNPVEQLDLDGSTYPVAKESTFQLPPKGEYTLLAPSEFPPAAFGRTKGGSLQIQVDPSIVEPTNEGYTVRFVKISAKTFDRGGKPASQVGDYLVANGFRGTITSEQELADAVEATAGNTYKAKLDWRAYNKRTGWSVEGMERFPKREDGTHQPWITDPSEIGKTDDEGRQLKVFANVVVPFNGFIPAVD